jgi:phospholipase C
VLAALVTAGCGSGSTPGAATATSSTVTSSTVTPTVAPTTTTATGPSAPCTGQAAPAMYAHVLVVVMENHGFAEVAGHSPYLNRLAAACGLATNSHGVAHPSLPNYLALTSGGTQGVTDDCTACSSAAPSVFQQVGADGWKAYQEDLPSVGYTGATSGKYAKKHNPAAYFTAVATAYATRAVPMGTVTAGALADDLAHDTLPRFGFLSPNLCNDEHDCPIATGDAWLATWIPQILASPGYRSGRTALFVTYDEDDNASGNRIYTVAVSPSVAAGTSTGATFDHYSLLATVEDLLGVGRLGNAAGATSMRPALRL